MLVTLSIAVHYLRFESRAVEDSRTLETAVHLDLEEAIGLRIGTRQHLALLRPLFVAKGAAAAPSGMYR